MTTNGTLPTGITTMLNTVRDAIRAAGIKGLDVTAYARGVHVTTRLADADEAARRISQAHAVLRTTDLPPSHITRQAPTVLRITGPKRRRQPTRV